MFTNRSVIHSSQFIVGSIDRKSGVFSISDHPEIHGEYSKALHEAQRLAALFPNKKFVVWAASAVAQVEPVKVMTETVVTTYGDV